MKSRCLTALAVLGALVLIVGCGQTKPKQQVHLTPVSRCQPADTAIQCSLPAPAVGSQRLLARPAVAFGVDFAWGPPSANWMRLFGYRFGASYLSYDPGKDWSSSLVNSFAKAEIARVFVWETTANRALNGCGAGASDARAARSEASPFSARAIYFAVDFELQPSEFRAVEAYFRCAGHVLGVMHTGAYGGVATIRLLFNSRLVHYGWQTYAWSGGAWDSRAQLEQYLNGNSFDRDRAIAADYGQTPYTAPGPSHRQFQTRLHNAYRYRARLRRTLLAQRCRVTRPSRHCKGVLHSGAIVNRTIRALHAQHIY